MAGGVCCDGGILIEWFEIEKNRTGAVPSFFCGGDGREVGRESFNPSPVTLLVGLFLLFESFRTYPVMCQVKPLDSHF